MTDNRGSYEALDGEETNLPMRTKLSNEEELPHRELNTGIKCGFWLSGLFNNTCFVIMIAGAKNISASQVGVVYLCSLVPSMLVKMTGPYWFHYFSYHHRMIITCLAMALSFLLVAFGELNLGLGFELLGICVGSAGSALGETSFLALAGFYPSREALSMWSSGTGMAGVVGYAWVIFFTIGMGFSFAATCLIANIIPLLFYYTFVVVMGCPSLERESATNIENDIGKGVNSSDSTEVVRKLSMEGSQNNTVALLGPDEDKLDKHTGQIDLSERVEIEAGTLLMTPKERFYNIVNLWPYMIPLFVVYYSEYAIMSGVWSAMGIPPHSKNARATFYAFANWTYQFGVFISRSSGTFFKMSLIELWIVPLLQVVNLTFFILDAYYLWWNDWGLIPVCFWVGLLGGVVYVQGYSLMAENIPLHLREFSLGASSMADSFGTSLATLSAIFIQKALYDYHGLSDDDGR